jgi:hypothetical protein
MEDSLEICLCLPNSRLKVRVSKYDHIGVLTDHFPACQSSQYLIIFANQVVMPAFTFAFYHVRNGDEIALIQTTKYPSTPPPPPRKPHFQRFPTLSELRERANELSQLFGYRNDGESMQRALDELTDPDVATESARLRDQSFNRIEGNLTYHRRLVRRFLSMKERKETPRIRSPSNEMPAPSAPNSEELPVLWGRRKKKLIRD